MKEFKYIIQDQEGIHARPAGLVVAEAKKYPNTVITITNKGKTADLKRIFGVMGLGVKKGEEVVIDFDGAEEEAAYAGVSKVFKDNL